MFSETSVLLQSKLVWSRNEGVGEGILAVQGNKPCFISWKIRFYVKEDIIGREALTVLSCVAGVVPDSRSPSPRAGWCAERNPYMDHQGGEDQGHLPHSQHVQLWRVTQLSHRWVLVSCECPGECARCTQKWRGQYFSALHRPIDYKLLPWEIKLDFFQGKVSWRRVGLPAVLIISSVDGISIVVLQKNLSCVFWFWVQADQSFALFVLLSAGFSISWWMVEVGG